MPIQLPRGDLDRTVTHEPNDDWPTMIEIVAYWNRGGRKRGRWRSVEIEADQFFGRAAHGAPMSGEQLIAAVERLRKMGPKP